MNPLIAYCGLNCEACDARLATVQDDAALREKTAKLWSALNGVEITPDMIHCTGCRVEGAKTPYCEAFCPIRRCASAKGVETCADCGQWEHCTVLSGITVNNPEAAARLRTPASQA